MNTPFPTPPFAIEHQHGVYRLAVNNGLYVGTQAAIMRMFPTRAQAEARLEQVWEGDDNSAYHQAVRTTLPTLALQIMAADATPEEDAHQNL